MRDKSISREASQKKQASRSNNSPSQKKTAPSNNPATVSEKGTPSHASTAASLSTSTKSKADQQKKSQEKPSTNAANAASISQSGQASQKEASTAATASAAFNRTTDISDTASPDRKQPAVDDVPLDTMDTTDNDASDKNEDTLAAQPNTGITDISIPNGSHTPASSLDTTPSRTNNRRSSTPVHVSPLCNAIDHMDLSDDEDHPPALRPEDLYTITDMNQKHCTTHDAEWQCTKPLHWRWELKERHRRLRTALPNPQWPAKKLNEYYDAFARDTAKWDFTIDDKPEAFPEILDKLIKMRNDSSCNAWSRGSYLATLGHHTQDALHAWDIDLLDIFHLQKLVKNGVTQVHDIAKAEWERQETEEYAFGTNNVIYNSRIFAVLTMKACTESLRDRITHEIGSEIRLLNDGAYVWVTLYKLIFPHQSTFQEVLRAKLKALTLAGYNHDFKKFSDQFAKFFKPIRKDIPTPELHDHWRMYLTQCLTHRSSWFRTYAYTEGMKYFRKYNKQPLSNEDHGDALLILIDDFKDTHATLIHERLPIKGLLPMDTPLSPSDDIAALFAYSNDNQNTIRSMLKSIDYLQKQVRTLAAQLSASTDSASAAPIPSATSVACPPTPPKIRSATSSAPFECENPPWQYQTPPFQPDEIRIWKGKTWHYCTKCLKHGSWVFSHKTATHTPEFGNAEVKRILKREPKTRKRQRRSSDNAPPRSSTPAATLLLPPLNPQLHLNFSKKQLPTSTRSAYPGTSHRLAATAKTKYARAFSYRTKPLLALNKSKPRSFHHFLFIRTP